MNYLKNISKILNSKEKINLYYIYLLIVVATILEFLSISSLLPLISIIVDPNYNNELINIVYNFFSGNFFLLSTTNTFIVIIIILFILKFIFLTFLSWYRATFNEKLVVRIKRDLFELYLKQEYLFFLKNHSSKLIRNLSVESNLLIGNINNLVIIILESSILIALILVIYLFQPIESVLVVFLIILLGALVYLPFKKILNKWGIIRQENDAKNLQHIQQGVGAIKDIKINQKEEMFINSFNLSSKLTAKAGKIRSFLFDFPRLWIELILILSVFIITIYFVKLGYEIEKILPSIGLFVAISLRALPSINRLIVAYQALIYSKPVVDLISSEFNLVNEKKEDKENQLDLTFSDNLELKNLSFSFGDKMILKNFNLNIKKKDIVGIIGKSGSGKTTLINLISGILKPLSGEILIDKKNFNFGNKKWMNKIGFLSQQTYIFDDSLKTNITLQKDKFNNETLKETIETACVNEIIEESNISLESNLGELGSKLSVGQVQRIGIARSLYKKPQLLILDEATSALDSKTEKMIVKNIINFCNKYDITLIMISHREFPLNYCNKVYNLETNTFIK